MKTRVLITGGAGFIGAHFVEHFLKNTDWDIVILDKLNYASNGFDRLRDINVFDREKERVSILSADFTMPIKDGLAKEIGEVDYIFHLGAETHVDNSISNPEPFVTSNVLGTMRMLNFARTLPNLKCFYQFSTDEVFGAAPGNTCYSEEDRHAPTNPYAATKSGAEMLVKAYRNTYKVPAIITRCMNVFGERQHPEKFIPLVIKRVLAGEEILIHSNAGKTKAGTRFYIHARNVAAAYLYLVKNGVVGEDYHITGEKEVDNLELAQFIAKTLDKPLVYKMTDFHSSRPGHDLRYCLKMDKLSELGWKLPLTFNESLKNTILWTVDRKDKWLNT